MNKRNETTCTEEASHLLPLSKHQLQNAAQLEFTGGRGSFPIYLPSEVCMVGSGSRFSLTPAC